MSKEIYYVFYDTNEEKKETSDNLVYSLLLLLMMSMWTRDEANKQSQWWSLSDKLPSNLYEVTLNKLDSYRLMQAIEHTTR